MFRRILALFIAFPLGAALVAIAVSNRQSVALILDPFKPENPALSIEMPFYAYLLGALVVGVVLGGVATWMGQSRWRQTARAQGQRAARWQAEADRLAREREASAARYRWKVEPAPSGPLPFDNHAPGPPRWRVTLEKGSLGARRKTTSDGEEYLVDWTENGFVPAEPANRRKALPQPVTALPGAPPAALGHRLSQAG